MTTPTMSGSLLSVRDLRTYFYKDGEAAKAVDGVSFDVRPGEILGLVGESGSGKSVTSLSILRLIPEPAGKIVAGRIEFNGVDLLQLSVHEIRKLRGSQIAMIFQEPMTSLNPVLTIGVQLIETLRVHERVSTRAARTRAADMLTQVGIPDAMRRLSDYPHQFSGGMRQRIMIAMALLCSPKLLIADEPTTALDVTTQAQVFDLMLDLKAKQTDAAILLITHDLSVVAELCDRVAVMYGGKIQEMGDVRQIFNDPKHPYTQGLLQSLPARQRTKRLKTIPGSVPSLWDLPVGCKFSTRCEHADDRCRLEEPILHNIGADHLVRCHLLEAHRSLEVVTTP